MADREILVEKLVIEVAGGGVVDDRTAGVVIAFTVGVETWRVTLSAMPTAELRELLARLQTALMADERIAALIEPSFTVPLDRTPVADP